MLQRKYSYPLSLILLIAFLFACSVENNDRADDTQPAKTLKAKIVYFSIPG